MLNYFRNQQLQPLLLQQQCWQIATVIQLLHILHPSVLYLTGKECLHLVRAVKLGVVMQMMSQLVVMTLLAKSQLNQSTSIPLVTNPRDSPHQKVLSSPESSQWSGFKIVVDNVDKNVRPSLQRLTHQTKSLHHFHSYAVKDRVNLSSALDASKSCLLDLSSFVMSSQDLNWFKDTCQVLVSRYILCTAALCLGRGTKYLAHFLRIIGYRRDVHMWGSPLYVIAVCSHFYPV